MDLLLPHIIDQPHEAHLTEREVEELCSDIEWLATSPKSTERMVRAAMDVVRATPDSEAPQLLVIGKRGWMNDNIVALLDDCAAIQPFVTEANGLSDGQIAAALSRSRAMLFPSFAEGLGIPMLEANAAGLKVIASDLPALREIAADDTVFLNPLDGPGWREAILTAAIP